MLPTPDTSHVSYQRVYEPSEDSFLLLDTLSSASEQAFLHGRFASSAPLVVELGTGSGVVIAFAHAHAQHIFGTRHILTAGIDMNRHACRATAQTVATASSDNPTTHGTYLASCMGDLTAPLRDHQVDVLVFNPPYVPTDEMPVRPDGFTDETPSFDDESYILALSYAGGVDGMETTRRLVDALPSVVGGPWVCVSAALRAEQARRRQGVHTRAGAWLDGGDGVLVGQDGRLGEAAGCTDMADNYNVMKLDS